MINCVVRAVLTFESVYQISDNFSRDIWQLIHALLSLRQSGNPIYYLTATAFEEVALQLLFPLNSVQKRVYIYIIYTTGRLHILKERRVNK